MSDTAWQPAPMRNATWKPLVSALGAAVPVPIRRDVTVADTLASTARPSAAPAGA